MATLKAAIIPVTPLQQNCSVVWKDGSKIAVVIDPGGDLPNIENFIHEQGLTLSKIFITHGHLDHAGGAFELAQKYGVEIEGPHKEDEFLVSTLEEQAKRFGLDAAKNFIPNRWLVEGDQIDIDGEKLDVYHCPGHTPGHVIFHHPESKLAIVGDVLFQGSIGRTDLWGGDFNTIETSIREVLYKLDEATTVITGHGASTTIGREIRTNAFVRG